MDEHGVERTIQRVTGRAAGVLKAAFPEGEDVLDPNRLTTSMEEIKHRLEALISAPSTGRLARLSWNVFRRFIGTERLREYLLANRDENARRDAENVQSLHRGPELLELLLAADARVRHGGLIAFFDLFPFDLKANELNLAPFNGLRDATQFEGEDQANAVMDAVNPICELMYQRVARGVQKLERFADGKSLKLHRNFGGVLAEARRRGGHASRILDLDAAFIRNAQAHGHFAYDLANHALVLWDRAGVRRSFPVAVLGEKVGAMAAFATSTASAVQQHYLHTYVIERSGVDAAFLDLLTVKFGEGSDEERQTELDRFIALIEREFGPLIQEIEPPSEPVAAASTTTT